LSDLVTLILLGKKTKSSTSKSPKIGATSGCLRFFCCNTELQQQHFTVATLITRYPNNERFFGVAGSKNNLRPVICR
jgi:hypothetical protein